MVPCAADPIHASRPFQAFSRVESIVTRHRKRFGVVVTAQPRREAENSSLICEIIANILARPPGDVTGNHVRYLRKLNRPVNHA